MVPQVRIERVAEIPGGRSWQVEQHDGEIVLQLLKEDISERAAQEVQRRFQNSVDSGRWVQHWPAPEGAPASTPIPTARAEGASTLPGDMPAMVLESDGEFVLLLLEEDVSKRGVAAVDQALRKETSSGHWTQNWPGDTAPGQTDSQS